MSYAFAADRSDAYGFDVRTDGTRMFNDASRAIVLEVLSSQSVDPNTLQSYEGALSVAVAWAAAVPSARDLAVGAALLGYVVLAGDNFGAPGTDRLLLTTDNGLLPQMTRKAGAEEDAGGYAVLFTPEQARAMFPGGTGIIVPTWLPPAPAPTAQPKPPAPTPGGGAVTPPATKPVEAGLFGLSQTQLLYAGAAAVGLLVLFAIARKA